MNRKLLVQVTAPTVVIGLLLFAACLVGAWFTDRSQRELAKLLSREVASLQAAQELEIRVRQLRWRTFLNYLDPGHARPEAIEEVRRDFEISLDRARRASNSAEEQAAVEHISAGYLRYQRELTTLPKELAAAGAKPDLHTLADKHPIRYVAEPCQELSRLNREEMAETVRESDRVGVLVRWTVGPRRGRPPQRAAGRLRRRPLPELHDLPAQRRAAAARAP